MGARYLFYSFSFFSSMAVVRDGGVMSAVARVNEALGRDVLLEHPGFKGAARESAFGGEM